MAFTLEVAESEINHLKTQMTETKDSIDRAINKIDRVEADISKVNVALSRLELTQNATLIAVNSIIENGGTGRCMERGIILDQIRRETEENKKKIEEKKTCANCKNESAIITIIERQKSLRTNLGLIVSAIITVTCGVLIWYFTKG